MAKTPELASASFMYTPPFSDEASSNRSSHNIYKEKPPIFCLDDAEEICCEYIDQDIKVDILKELSSKSMITTVGKKIFDGLTDRDLLRASHVSSTWRTIIKYADIKSGRRMNRFLKKMKRSYELNKENRESFKKSFVPCSLRLPLSSSNMNLDIVTNSKLSVESSTLLTLDLNSKDKYKQCPECQSPAKVSYQQVGHCTKCNTDFCIHCFYSKEKHSPTCQVIGGPGTVGSPRKLTNSSSHRYSINAKDNKARLKRL